jgi:Fe-S cluster assembly iron-binding protein IscA
MDRIFRNIEGYEIIAPSVVGADYHEDIVITDRAMDILLQELSDSQEEVSAQKFKSANECFIRLYIHSSPSVAKQYAISIDDQLTPFDRVFELRKAQIVIDRKSLFHFMGIVIDYYKNGDEDGFIFIEAEKYENIDLERMDAEMQMNTEMQMDAEMQMNTEMQEL